LGPMMVLGGVAVSYEKGTPVVAPPPSAALFHWEIKRRRERMKRVALPEMGSRSLHQRADQLWHRALQTAPLVLVD